MAQACSPPCLSYELLHKTLKKFCWGPLVCSFLFNFGAIIEIPRLPDFKPVDFFAVWVVFAPSILFQTLNFNVIIFSQPICCLVLMCFWNFLVGQFNENLLSLYFNFLHSISTFCTQFQLSAPFEILLMCSQWMSLLTFLHGNFTRLVKKV